MAKFGFGMAQYARDMEARRPKSDLSAVDPTGELAGTSREAAAFGRTGQQGFRATGNRMTGVADQLARMARGEDSMSAEQLRQGMQQNVAAQQAMAGAAAPQNAGMAMRNAMRNAAMAGAGLSGQQALAGIQERQAATSGLANLLAQMRQQELQAALGGRGQALQGFGGLEQNRLARYQIEQSQPDFFDRLLGAGQGAATIYATANGIPTPR